MGTGRYEHRWWTEEEEDLLRRDREKGVPTAETARVTGRTSQAVRHKAMKMGLPKLPRGQRPSAWTDERVRKAIVLLDRGMAYREVLDRMGGGTVSALHRRVRIVRAKESR